MRRAGENGFLYQENEYCRGGSTGENYHALAASSDDRRRAWQEKLDASRRGRG